MAKTSGAAWVLLTLTFTMTIVTSRGNLAASHSMILEKFHPVVREFSADLTHKLGESNARLEEGLYDVITKLLASQMDKLAAKSLGDKNGMCCKCLKCARNCTLCEDDRKCCCDGSGGCYCRTCEGGAPGGEMLGAYITPSVTSQTPSRRQWTESTRELLIRQLRSVVSEQSPSANDKCCLCTKCSGYTIACHIPVCCKSGNICVCKSCDGNQTMQMSSIRDFVSLTPEAEAAVGKVGDLLDDLMTLMDNL